MFELTKITLHILYFAVYRSILCLNEKSAVIAENPIN